MATAAIIPPTALVYNMCECEQQTATISLMISLLHLSIHPSCLELDAFQKCGLWLLAVDAEWTVVTVVFPPVLQHHFEKSLLFMYCSLHSFGK